MQQGLFSSQTFLASFAVLILTELPIGEKNEGTALCILTFSFFFFQNGIILLGKLCVAFLADFNLVSVNLPLIKALDGSSLAYWASCSSIVELIADTCSSMCFGHTLLLIQYLFPVEYTPTHWSGSTTA